MKVESSRFFDFIVRKTVTFETTIRAKSEDKALAIAKKEDDKLKWHSNYPEYKVAFQKEIPKPDEEDAPPAFTYRTFFVDNLNLGESSYHQTGEFETNELLDEEEIRKVLMELAKPQLTKFLSGDTSLANIFKEFYHYDVDMHELVFQDGSGVGLTSAWR